MGARVGVIQAAIARVLEETATPHRLVTRLIQQAAHELGIDATPGDLEKVVNGIVRAVDQTDDHVLLDVDTPCSLGADEAQVRISVEALVAEMVRTLPDESDLLVDRVAAAVQQTLHAPR